MHFIKSLFPKLNQPSHTTRLQLVTPGKRIPKIIHQTHYLDVLPPEINENIEKIKAMNPGWDYRYYNDNDILQFIKDNFGNKILDYFNRINPSYGAARADLFRYLVVYKCGGVYLDIKSSLTAPLDSILTDNDTYLLSYWKNKPGDEFEGFGLHPELNPEKGEFQQWHVISAPGHPFLKAVIEAVLRNIDTYIPSLHGVGQHGVLRVTGPVAYTLAINRLLSAYPCRIVNTEEDIGLKYSIYKKFSHMHIAKAGHYTLLKDSVILLPRIKKYSSDCIHGLKKMNDNIQDLSRIFPRLKPNKKFENK